MDKTVLIPTPQQYDTWTAWADAMAATLEKFKTDISLPQIPLIVLSDSKAAGMGGGSFNNGAWQIRDLNTEDDTMNICLLKVNSFVVPRGRYFCWVSAPGNQVGWHKARLWSVTRNEAVLWGTSENSGTTTTTRSVVMGSFTVTENTELRVEHRCQTSRAADGFGAPNNFGGPEVYTTLSLQGLG